MTRVVKPHSEKLDDVIIETAKGQEFTVGEIKHSSRIQKSATPKQDLSWYIKWIASLFILTSMSMRGIDGLQLFDLILILFLNDFMLTTIQKSHQILYGRRERIIITETVINITVNRYNSNC